MSGHPVGERAHRMLAHPAMHITAPGIVGREGLEHKVLLAVKSMGANAPTPGAACSTILLITVCNDRNS
jgi:hypothetical protein